LANLFILFVPAAICASLVVVGATVLGNIGPSTLACVTWGVGSLVLLGMTGNSLRSRARMLRQEIWLIGFCAVTGVAAFQALWYAGLLSASPVNVAILTVTLPVMIAAASAVLLKEHLSSLQLLGVVFTLAGALWVGVLGDIRQLWSLRLGHGEILVLLAYASMTAYTVMLKWRPSALPPLDFMAATALVGTIALLPWAFAEGGLSVAGWHMAVQHWCAILYIGVLASAGAYLVWNQSVARNGANVTAMSLYTMPAFAVAFCWAFLGQPVLRYHWLGLLVIFVGILLVLCTARVAR
jgi:drug/metabolite transporter (DMT)-like permease